jgi:DNA-binding XRE family transcriptional regulator
MRDGIPAIKIGISRDAEVRTKFLGVEMLAWHEGTGLDEDAAHRRFAHLDLGNEWFRPEQDLMEYIKGLRRTDAPPVFPARSRMGARRFVEPVDNVEVAARIEHGKTVDARFRARVRVLRKNSGLSQADLGVAVGIDRFAVSGIENGKRTIYMPEAVFICKALGVDLGDMLGDGEPVLVTDKRIEFRPHATSSR